MLFILFLDPDTHPRLTILLGNFFIISTSTTFELDWIWNSGRIRPTSHRASQNGAVADVNFLLDSWVLSRQKVLYAILIELEMALFIVFSKLKFRFDVKKHDLFHVLVSHPGCEKRT